MDFFSHLLRLFNTFYKQNIQYNYSQYNYSVFSIINDFCVMYVVDMFKQCTDKGKQKSVINRLTLKRFMCINYKFHRTRSKFEKFLADLYKRFLSINSLFMS